MRIIRVFDKPLIDKSLLLFIIIAALLSSNEYNIILYAQSISSSVLGEFGQQKKKKFISKFMTVKGPYFHFIHIFRVQYDPKVNMAY